MASPNNSEPQWLWLVKLIVEGAVLLVVIFYTVAAYQQRNAMLESNKITRDTNELAQRAWVGVESSFLDPQQPEGQAANQSVVIVRVHNAGATPAREVYMSRGHSDKMPTAAELDPPHT